VAIATFCLDNKKIGLHPLSMAFEVSSIKAADFSGEVQASYARISASIAEHMPEHYRRSIL